MLEAEIRKNLKEFLLEISLAAGEGCLGILGASGCGKSVTLKTIAGILTPDEGKIRLNGRTLYDSAKGINETPQKRRVGYLFQDYALFPNMTVRENIGASPFAKAGRVRELMKRFCLAGLENRYPDKLSGGQKQRVALARVLASEPEALLLDEPFSAMDAHLKERLRLELRDVLTEFGGAAVLVTHDRDEAYELSRELVLLSNGRVAAGGATRDIFESPGSIEAARLTGCKNISPVRRIGAHRVYAIDWGLELTTASEVTGEITAVGIRAHDFCPLPEQGIPGPELINRIPVGRATAVELPFEWYITLENGLWWKTGKAMGSHGAGSVIPKELYVAPEAVLVLKP